MMNEEYLQRDELQGMIVSGYQRQKAMCCFLFAIEDPMAVKTWLRGLDLTYYGDVASDLRMNIAFTCAGLEVLGVPRTQLMGFSREFREGMVTPHRQRILGDLVESRSDPNHWRWGGPLQTQIHILLLVYETTSAALDQRCDQIRNQAGGLREIRVLASSWLEGKEHFGFMDGMSQPWIKDIGRQGQEMDRVAAGEFILGLNDESGFPEPAPPLASHGSYLVVRQIVQDVRGFWQCLQQLAGNQEPVRLAAKMMGRWPNGTPLTLAPDQNHSPERHSSFRFRPVDSDGSRCPFGAHIRRANPRDGLIADGPTSLEVVKRHRLLRRGRPFGLPADATDLPHGIDVQASVASEDQDGERGLFFMCLNASIARQFEFVQNAWINNPKFLDLASETDPIAAPYAWQAPHMRAVFSVQGHPVRTRFEFAERFIHTIGGGYFFLPSRSAIQKISGSD